MKGLTLKEMHELPVVTSAYSGNCPICLLDMQGDLRMLPCCHAFHENCIFQWLRINTTCPNCRYPMKKTSI